MIFDYKSFNLRKITPFAGLMGCFLVLFGLYASASNYFRPDGYSPANHFISELGLSDASTMAHIFNRSVMSGGILMMIFALGLGNFIGKGKREKVATLVGMIATLAFSGIGYFTAVDHTSHLIVAMIFFGGAMVSILLFSYTIWVDRESGLNVYISFHGVLIAVIYVITVFAPKELLFQSINDPDHFVRPDIWELSILEWVYCFLILSWIVLVALNMIYIEYLAPKEDYR